MESQTTAVVTLYLKGLVLTLHSDISRHGVVGVVQNREGKTVLIRAELDSPRVEGTGLPSASTKTMTDRYGNERLVMHACGHYINMATLLAATSLLQTSKEHWGGTLLVVFQPNEEKTEGAKAIIDDRLYSKVLVLNVMLRQHVTPIRGSAVVIGLGTY